MGVSACRPTRAEIDLGACVANLRRLRRQVGGKEVWPVVKADAYGHGAVEVARALAAERIAGFCVATASEGRELRHAGIERPILVLSGVASGSAGDGGRIVVEYGLSCAVQDGEGADTLAQASRAAGVGPVSVHLKVDTGMGRFGAVPGEVIELAERVDDEPTLSLDGVFSNLATGDSFEPDDPGAPFARAQAALFVEVCEALQEAGHLPPHRTLANSAAILHHTESWQHEMLSGVRPGLAIYGATLTPGHSPIELQPAMRLRTQITAIRSLPKGVTVGYGMAATTYRPSRIAVLPLGYHDGLPRSLSNRGWVFLRGRRAPIIGRISMDLTLVDVTDFTSAQVGDEVVLFGAGDNAVPDQQERETGYAATLATALGAVEGEVDDAAHGRARPGRGVVRVEEVAAWADTIAHEILSRVGTRVPRVYANAESISADAPIPRRYR